MSLRERVVWKMEWRMHHLLLLHFELLHIVSEVGQRQTVGISGEQSCKGTPLWHK